MSFGDNKQLQAALGKALITLESKVEPSHTALLIVDVQNDFCAAEGALGKEGKDLRMVEAMVPRLVKFTGKAREAGVTVIFIQAIYFASNNWYLSDAFLERPKRLGRKAYISQPVCEQGAWGADFYGVRPLPGETVISKHRFSAFIGTELDLVLRSRGIRTLIMSGVATDVCVASTAQIGFFKDYYIVFMKDLTATYSEEAHNSALKNIETYYGVVSDSNEVAKCWQTAREAL